jgi:aspartate/methionine/tyrosine aminotransferase
VQATGLSGREFMTRLYRAEKVSVIDGGAFGKGTSGFVRVCFATSETELREGCRRIGRFVQSLQSN